MTQKLRGIFLAAIMLAASSNGASAKKDKHSTITFRAISQGVALFDVARDSGCSDLIRTSLKATKGDLIVAGKAEQKRLDEHSYAAPNSCYLNEGGDILTPQTEGIDKAIEEEEAAVVYYPKYP